LLHRKSAIIPYNLATELTPKKNSSHTRGYLTKPFRTTDLSSIKILSYRG